jgi:hypothetical protein
MMPIRAKLKPQRKAGLEMVASHAVEVQARKNTKFPSRLRKRFFTQFLCQERKGYVPAFPKSWDPNSEAQN